MPAREDPQSNYRWSSDDQVVAARLIARLRRVGLPLADIAPGPQAPHGPPRWWTTSSERT